MPVTADAFRQAWPSEPSKPKMTRTGDRLEADERRFELEPADLAAFQRLPRRLPVLVLAEDWCGDVIDNLPILGRIAAASGKLELRIFLRDQNPDLMDQYLNQGQFRSIPVFVFFDEHFAEIGRFIERPASVTERRARQRRELFAHHPEFGSPDTPADQLPEDVRVTLMQELTRLR